MCSPDLNMTISVQPRPGAAKPSQLALSTWIYILPLLHHSILGRVCPWGQPTIASLLIKMPENCCFSVQVRGMLSLLIPGQQGFISRKAVRIAWGSLEGCGPFWGVGCSFSTKVSEGLALAHL